MSIELTPSEKYAYRHLLYLVLLEIRSCCWDKGSPEETSKCLALADWVHNLAQFSAIEFRGFDPDVFWREHTWFCERHPELQIFRDNYNLAVARHQSGDGGSLKS
jgi:hypothetical protein